MGNKDTRSFGRVLEKYRVDCFSQRDKGYRFERLMQAYLKTDPKYAGSLSNVWLWNEFPSKDDFGGRDTGIDLVALTDTGDYWAVQCKCYQDTTTIDKGEVDGFLSTSSRSFTDIGTSKQVEFSQRLWISTTNKWGMGAEETIRNQQPPVTRLNLYELEEAPVDWEKLEKGITGDASRKAKKDVRPHQLTAITNANEHFKKNDRGKLIMACGTGKTFTSLRIAEKETGGSGLVLFLVPSIALLGQTLREWTADAKETISPICICSDPEITKKKGETDDAAADSVVDLAWPASTNTESILRQFEHIRRSKKEGLTVVFSTYQSIEVIARAQKKLIKAEGGENAYGIFDLIICDEAHRTTGVTLCQEDSAAFVKVHDSNFIKAKKRLYMTATPRLYSDDSKAKAAKADAVLCSMDDVNIYGEEIYRIGFGEAVENDLLSDYKVLILTLSENDVPPAIQKMIADENSEINSDDASKLIGCINALSKQVIGDDGAIKSSDPEPMKRAVAFCQSIKISKKITNTFNDATKTYLNSLEPEKREKMVSVDSMHIDGTMAAPARDELLSWLKADIEPNECRILTNVRCLSEGVDVPSLDAVLFLSARNSQVDVVQSVGRVMRKSPGKKYGYIIIPVVIAADKDEVKALDDNERYKVVWSVLNALRAHDDRFNATINKIELNKKRPSQILVGRPDGFSDEGSYGGGEPNAKTASALEAGRQLEIQFEQLQSVVFARMVQKVGDRRYWEQWARNVAEIAERQVERITKLVNQKGAHEDAFGEFLGGLQKNINPSITKPEAIEMLSQHIITKPVFDALFEGYSFVQNNAISVSMQKMIDMLEAQAIEKDTESLNKFYESVKKRAAGIDNAEGKQRIIIELYDKFFKTAFPRMVEKLGIVYTPVEVVDFIIRSVDEVLQKEFGRSVSDENIHILDPFTGTGTFITRLLQSGLIKQKDLKRKYTKEIHANEIVLLAYYIAAVNIESAYHDILSNGGGYEPFDGICLTDTFQLGETEESRELFSKMFPQNSHRVAAQKKAPLRVIIGNPPYSVGQKSENDNSKNQSYPILDDKIAKSYVKESTSGLNKSSYDAYIKAFRWSSDRLDKEGGIIAFVSNGAWLDSNSQDGFRKCLEREFSSIYVFNLRGNQRTSGELSRKEGGKIFGSGSRTPITITLLVKNPQCAGKKAKIHYNDIGDYLSREDKLSIIKNLGSISNPQMSWKTLEPNEHGDWLNQRNDIFETFIQIEATEKFDIKSQSFFVVKSPGVSSGRDSWVYNFSKTEVYGNMNRLISFYNQQGKTFQSLLKNETKITIEDFIETDPKKISWTVNLKKDLQNGRLHVYRDGLIRKGSYRPFCKQNVYFDKLFIERPGSNPCFFPQQDCKNYVICATGVGSSKSFSTLMTDCLPNYDSVEKSQCFPLYYYEEKGKEHGSLFDKADDRQGKYIRHDGVSDFILGRAKKLYGKDVYKEDIFYYVYGLLHSEQYRERFANDLKKMLPRLPLVESGRDFWKFSKAGRTLAELHIGYEGVEPAPGVVVVYNTLGQGKINKAIGAKEMDALDYRVEKMRFVSKGDKSRIIYNSGITIDNIPEKAYEYVVNGKSAIEWIMERYQVKVDKDSGIRNDPNDWAREQGDPKYILKLLLSVINVSLQTVEIVKGLPGVAIDN